MLLMNYHKYIQPHQVNKMFYFKKYFQTAGKIRVSQHQTQNDSSITSPSQHIAQVLILAKYISQTIETSNHFPKFPLSMRILYFIVFQTIHRQPSELFIIQLIFLEQAYASRNILFIIIQSKNANMLKAEHKHLRRYASLNIKLIKSINLHSPHHKRTETCNLPLKIYTTKFLPRKDSLERVNFESQIDSTHEMQRYASIRRKEDSQDRQKLQLSKLYGKIYKLKYAHLRTEATAGQKDRFMRKLRQTISAQEFKAIGYDFDPSCCSLLFDYLKNSKSITKIILDNNPLGDQGILKLAELVQYFELEQLSLVSVGMGNKGAAALFTGLQIKCTIRKLNISSMECAFKNKVTSDGANNLREFLNAKQCLLTTLHMDYVSLGSQGLKCAFEGIKNSRLQELTLSKNELSPKRMPIFANGIANTSLLRLDLSCNNLGNNGCKSLSELLGTNYGKNCISNNLTRLNLNSNNINSIGLESFCRDMSSNQTLQTLIFDNNPLSQGDRFFNIKYYLTKTLTLKKLSLVKIGCREKEIRFLGEGIEANRALQQLDLSKNQIGCQSFSILFLMISRNKSLKRLKLNTCKISDNYLLKNEFQITGGCYPHIQEIQMENSYIGNKGAAILQRFIHSNANMLRLNLAKNCVGERLLLAINQTLQENQRKRPFDAEFKHLEAMENMNEQKKAALKGQIQKNKSREEFLQKLMIVGDIHDRGILEDNLNLQIKNEKRSIKRIKKKRRGSKVAKTKMTEPSEDLLQFLSAVSNRSLAFSSANPDL